MIKSSLRMLALLAGASAAGWAQQALFVEYDGNPELVRAIRDGAPCIARDGRLVPASGARAALGEVRECLPFFVAVRNVRAVGSHLDLSLVGAGTGEVNHTFEFHADFESALPLENVFIVLELELESGPQLLFGEVGELEPRQARHVTVYGAIGDRLREEQWRLHLFSNGGELLHSLQPEPFREQMLDRMVARRIEGVENAPPRPFVGPGPEYPESQLKVRASGEAVVKVRLARTGAVVAAEVRSATAPEFGEAASAAVRQWRFLPAIKDGAPVEARLELPFRFVPPEPETK